MKSFFRKLFVTIWFWLGISFATLTTSAFCLVWGLLVGLDHDNITFFIEHIMAEFTLHWMKIPGFWKLNHYLAEGVEDDMVKPSNGPYILAANHNSIIDTLFMALLVYKKTYTYNRKYRYVPFFGQLCMLAGYLGINTKDNKQKAQIVPQICTAVRNGYSVLIYPEGTRNKNPEINEISETIKTGMFRVASQTGCSILPISIKGSDAIVGRYGICDVGAITIIFGEPIKVAKDYNIDEMKIVYRNIINRNLRYII